MNKEKVFTVSEKTTENPFGEESLNDKKRRVRRAILLLVAHYACLAYNGWFILSIDPEKIGRRTSVNILIHYILPAVLLFTMVLSFMTIVPFILLYFLSTPRSSYPAKQNPLDSMIMTIFMICIQGVSLIGFYILSIDLISYFYFCFYKSSLIENLTEKLLTISCLAALVFNTGFLIEPFVDSYNSFLDAITMWKFAILQIRQSRNLQA